MADTAISGLTALAGADVADTDKLAIADVGSSETKHITPPELVKALQSRGLVKFVIDEPADGLINEGECYIWLSTGSPQTLNVKAKDTSSPAVIFSAVL